MPCCCIRFCNNRSETKTKGADGITFHLFPRDERKRGRWQCAVRRENWRPTNTSVVCSRHFNATCFYTTRSGLVRLLDDSVPTLHIPPDDSRKTPAGTVPENEGRDRRGEGRLETLAVLRAPALADDDPPEAHRLAADVRRLLIMCKKQRRSIRGLQRRLRAQDDALGRLRHPQLSPACLQELCDERHEEAEEGIKDDLYWA